MRPFLDSADFEEVGIPQKLLGAERFRRRRVVVAKTTGVGASLPVRSRFKLSGTASRSCPPGFRRVGGQCVARDEIGSKVSVRQIRHVTTKRGGSPSLIQAFIERFPRKCGPGFELVNAGTRSEKCVRIARVSIRDRPAPFVRPVLRGPVRDSPAPILNGDRQIRTSRFIDLNRDGIDDRDSIVSTRDLSRPQPGKDFCPTCERQSPKPQALFDSRPLITDLSPQEAKRGSKKIVVGISLAVVAVVGLKFLKVF